MQNCFYMKKNLEFSTHRIQLTQGTWFHSFLSDRFELNFDFSRLTFDFLISLHELFRRILCQCKQNQSTTQIRSMMAPLSCWNWLKFALNIPIQLTQFRHQTCYLHTVLGYTSVRTKSRVETIFIEDDAGLLSLKQVLGETVHFDLNIRPPTSCPLKKNECKAVSTKYVSIQDNIVMNLIRF